VYNVTINPIIQSVSRLMVTPTRDSINTVSLVEVIYNCSSSRTNVNSYFMKNIHREVESYFDFEPVIITLLHIATKVIHLIFLKYLSIYKYGI
jgi:hypothetical protein